MMNFTEFNKTVRILVLICISVMLIDTIRSGAILTFLHPRSLPLLKVTIGILGILILNDFKSFGKLSIKAGLDWKMIVLLIPVFLALYVKPSGLSSRLAVQKGLSFTIPGQMRDVGVTGKDDSSLLPIQMADLISDSDTVIALSSESNVLEKTDKGNNNINNTKADEGYISKGGKKIDKVIDTGYKRTAQNNIDNAIYDSGSQKDIRIDNVVHSKIEDESINMQNVESAIKPDTIFEDSMYMKFGQIYTNPKEYENKIITMVGFITADTILGSGSFYIARMLITCCAADAMPVGFYCFSDSLSGMRDGDWTIITGKIEQREIKLPWMKKSEMFPVLKVLELQKTIAPRMQYIYPVAY